MVFKEFYNNKLMRQILVDGYQDKQGMYALSFDGNLLLAYLCDEENPRQLNPCGDTLFVQYMQGDIEALLHFLDPTQITHIAFQRNKTGKIKRYEITRFLSHAL